jgi:uncharacterized membrane protein
MAKTRSKRNTNGKVPRPSARRNESSNERIESNSWLAALTRRNVEIVAELENSANDQRSATDRLADVITAFVGSMAFVYIHVLWFGLWVGLNTLPILPEGWRIDPFPFTFLTFIVSLEAIFLSTFILISQNHEERLARRRNHLDLQINMLSEQENSAMLKTLDAIARRLDIHDDQTAEQLAEPTEPGELVTQIKEVIEDSDK